MKKLSILLLAFLSLFFISTKSTASHGMALVNPSFTVGPTGLTFAASSNSATCGGGPYWLQVELRCTAGQLTGTPPASMQTNLLNWAGPGVTYNNFPWYNSLLNVPNYNLANSWTDACVTEPYHNVFIPFTSLCPGQTYWFSAREWVSGTNSVGPWTAPSSFVVPGAFNPLAFLATANPTIFCAPGSSTLTVSGITGGCGQSSILWLPSNSTVNPLVVSPAATTNYTAVVSTPCNTLTRVLTVSVVPGVSAAFTPMASTTCIGSNVVFNHTGTAGASHTWACTPATNTIVTVNSASPTITFGNAGVYTISHTVAIGTCSQVVTTNMTVGGVTSAFTMSTPNQCLQGNSYTFNASSAVGSHTYAFNPAVGAPLPGVTPNYGPVSFTSPGTYTVSHTVNNGGCISTTNSVITINPQPTGVVTPSSATCGFNNGQIFISNTSIGQTITGFSVNGVGVPTQTVINLAAGIYTVAMINSLGCRTTYTTSILNTPPITNVVLTYTNATCGNNNAVIGIGAVTGGTPTYSFSLNGGPYTATSPITNLAPGTHTIGVIDSRGCVFTKIIVPGNTPGPSLLSFSTTPSSCTGGAGTATIGVTGGLAPYTYSINGVSSGSIVTGLGAGTYTALVASAQGCTITSTFIIGTLSGPSSANVGITNATCGNANGSATVTSVSGGLAPYQYSWNGGPFGASNINTGLTTGTYTVIVRDANTCTISVIYNIINGGNPTSNISASNSITCNGGATGSFTVNTSGGTPGYSYTITPGGGSNATGIFTGLTAQAYTVTVRDAAGCTTSVTITLAQPTALTLNLTPFAVSCNAGTNGSVTAVAGGGTSPYQYSLNGGPFGGSSSFTGLAAGIQSVTVQDINGCLRTTTINITQPTPLAVTFTTAPTTCIGSVGTSTIGVTGGTPVYSYSVNSVSSTSLATGLAAGSYTATVSDANGCIINGIFNINMVAGPTAANVLTGNATCGNANGSATVSSVTGGVAPYQYSFNGGPFSLTNNTGGLTAGTHTVVVRDNNNCTYTLNFNINNTGSPSSSISASVNVSCFGGNNGSFSVSTTGGTPGYSYTLSPVGTINTTGNFTGLTAQNYNVTISDAVGCLTSATITLTQPTALTLTLTPTPVSCNAGANGSITAAAGGGNPGYAYSINGGPFVGSGNFTGLIAGTYTVTVRDNNNCLFNTTAIITQPTLLNIATVVAPNSCAGSVGSVTITASGGTPVYTYSVDGVGSANIASPLTNGTHTATIQDANGCSINGTFNIGNITGPVTATINTTNANCGNANGSATLTGVTGGQAPYQYSWNGSPFSTNAFTAGLLAGTHTLTIIDANTCTLTVTYNIGNTGSPVSSIGAVANVSCFGGANGSFTINTAGGTPGYSYTLTPTNATSGSGVFAGLTAQAYSALVMDAAGCVTTVTVNISQPTALSLTLSSLPTSCNGSANGTITAAGSGGTGPYQYNLNGGPFQASGVFTGNSAAIYNITLQDNNGCTLTQSVQVTQPTPITLTFTSVNANCTAANGTASVTASGGTPFYNYNWTGGGGSSSQTNPLAAGVYSVTVTDANGCTRTGTTTIGITPGGTAVISASVNVSCNGGNNGSMTAGFTGAMNAPISYSWSNGQTTQTAINLIAGPYSVTLTDAFGCTSTVAGNISEPAALDVMTGTTAVSCFGGSNGTGTAIYNGGGTPPLTYLWAPGGATTATAPNLPAGVYSVTTTDSKGCFITLTVQITQPTSVTVTSTVTTANCNQSNGSATLTASGGTGPYTYTWSTTQTGPVLSGAAAGTYTVNVQDANGCIFTSAATIPNSAGPSLAITGFTNVSCFGGNNGVATTSVTGGTAPYIYLWSNGQNTGTGTNFPAGVHTATVTDQNGCSASVSVTITQPTALTLSVSGTDPLCFNATNGTANAGMLGGTPGYNYNWVPSGSTLQTPVGLGPGVHLVTVTDANGCIINGSVALNNPAQMTAAITSTNVSCFGACNGMANGSSANTVGAVIYSWAGGPGPLSTQNVTNLCPGTYTVVATDQNGCTAQALTTITQPPLLTASITASGNASCATYTNGFATVAPAGGTPGYTYSWSPSGGTGSTANNLGAGTYVATITDAQGCIASTNIIITQPTPLAATLTSTNITCFGANNGISNVAYSGGTGPYNFLWFPTLNNTSNVNTLPPGTHTIQITDNLGCVTTLTTTIIEPPALTAAISSTNSNCNQANGNACVLAGGGAGGYTYQWTSNPLFTNSCINNVVAGAYTVTVTDVNGCTVNAIANINDIAGPSLAITATTAVSCFGGSNGSAITTISGGTGTISALWSYLAQTTQNVNNLPAGLHSITITDAAGCITSASVQITQPTQLMSAITNVTMVTCSGASNGSATMLVNGGTPGYNYNWTPSAQSSSIAVSLSPGTYTCFVTDANGCPTSQQVTITQPNPLTISSFSVTHLTCNGNNTGQINTTITGGSPAYTLVWTPAQPSNAVITNLAAGTYSLLVTDTKSCTVNGVYVVTEPSALVTSATATPATCGNANGSATVTVSGGSPGYAYNWNSPTIQITPVATGLSSNTWSCTITDSKGCIITQSVNVPNAPGPVLSSMSFTAPLCFGQQNGSMAINFTSGTAPFGVLWNNPSASTTPTVNGVGAGVYSATVTDVYGCTANGVVNVTQPNILILNVNADATICYGELTQIYAAGGGGTPAYTYTWNPATIVGGGPHTETPTVTTQYIVTMSDANGCTVNPKTITINVRPQLLATGYAVTRCHGDGVNLIPTLTSPGNGGPYTYNWTGGSTASQIQVIASYPTNPNTYTVNINDGCTSPGATAVFTVNVNPLPSGSFTGDILKGCAPLGVIFTAQSNGGSGDVYNWNMSGGTGSDENGSPKPWVFTDAGVYTVTLNITNSTTGCTKDTVATNYIEVYPVPIAEFTANMWETTILDPNINFTNLSVGANSYYWDFGDIASSSNNSTIPNPSHFYENAGSYSVWLVAFNDKGCRDTVMHKIEILPEYALYIPNTFTPDDNNINDTFQPKGVGIDESSYKMYIYDRWGELIFTSDEFRKGWDGSVRGSAAKVAEQGVYVYKILVKDMQGNVHQYIGHVNCLPRQSKVD